MKKLLINGIYLDSNTEVELIPENKQLGWSVKVTFLDGYVRSFQNVTEVHWLFNKSEELAVERHINRTAIESDIHSTGQLIQNDLIQELEIVPSTRRFNSFTN
jgi:hypothetical protein